MEADSKDTQGRGDDDGEAKGRRPRRERKDFDGNDENASRAAAQSKSEDVSPLPDQQGARPRRRRAGDAPTQEKEQSGSGGGGGWMSSPSKQTNKLVIEEDDKDSANPMNKEKFFQEGNDDILLIPDLDEDGYDGDQRVAHAPKNINRKIPSLADLENDVKSAIPSAEGGLDLGVLLRSLVPAIYVQEPDVLWSFESILRDITDELAAPVKTVAEPINSIGNSSNNNSSSGNNNGSNSNININSNNNSPLAQYTPTKGTMEINNSSSNNAGNNNKTKSKPFGIGIAGNTEKKGK